MFTLLTCTFGASFVSEKLNNYLIAIILLSLCCANCVFSHCLFNLTLSLSLCLLLHIFINSYRFISPFNMKIHCYPASLFASFFLSCKQLWHRSTWGDWNYLIFYSLTKLTFPLRSLGHLYSFTFPSFFLFFPSWFIFFFLFRVTSRTQSSLVILWDREFLRLQLTWTFPIHWVKVSESKW